MKLNFGIFLQLPDFTSRTKQISAKRGTDSRFDLEENLKSLYPRSSRSSIMKKQNRAKLKQEYKPSSNSSITRLNTKHKL